MFPFGEVVRFQSRVVGVRDLHGDLVDSWGDPVSVPGCAFDPGTSVESRQTGREPVVSSPRVFVPAGAKVTVGRRDRAIVRGREYTVQGDPAVWRSPFTGWEPGTVVELEVVDG